MQRYTLRFQWGVSRGRDTYGYTICSLFVNGDKVASCNGGGYDMKGTCLGNWIASTFSNALRQLGKKEFYGLTFHDPNFDPGKVVIDGESVEDREKAGKSLGLERYQQFYSGSSKVSTENHTVPSMDGACGFNNMEDVFKAIDGSIRFLEETSKMTLYEAELKEVA